MTKLNFKEKGVVSWMGGKSDYLFLHDLPKIMRQASIYAKKKSFHDISDFYKEADCNIADAIIQKDSSLTYEGFSDIANFKIEKYKDKNLSLNHERILNFLNRRFSNNSNLFSLYHDSAELEKIGLIIPERPFVAVSDQMSDEIWTKKDWASNVVMQIAQNSFDHGMRNTDGLSSTYIVNINGEEVDNNNYKVSIQDQGKGISKKNIEHIFDKDFTTRKEVNGHGIGLWCAKQFVNENGGIIEANSKVGEGTEISFTIPNLKKVGDYYIQE